MKNTTITPDEANHRDLALMLRTVRTVRDTSGTLVKQGGGALMLRHIEESLCWLQQMHVDAGIRLNGRTGRD